MVQGRLQKGDLVIVRDPDSPLFEEVGEVMEFDESADQYIVALYDGLSDVVDARDITKLIYGEDWKRLSGIG